MTVKYTNAIIITTIYILGLLLSSIMRIPLSIIFLLLILTFLIFLKFKDKRILLWTLPFLSAILLWTFINSNIIYSQLDRFFNKKGIIEIDITSFPTVDNKNLTCYANVRNFNGHKVKGIVKLYSRIKDISRGNRILIRGKIVRNSGANNFGEFDYGIYYKRLKIDGTIFLRNKEEIILYYPVNRISFTYLGSKVRQDIKRYLDKYFLKVQNGFLNAVIVGDRSYIPTRAKNIFINTGTIHILAISGLHIGIIMFVLFIILKTFGVSKRYSLLITVIVIIFYLNIVGYKAPVVRASLMFVSFTLCYFLDRDRNYLNALFLAALFILLFKPDSYKEVSFQLSFLATAGIILFNSDIERLFEKSKFYSNKIGLYAIRIFSASASAQILMIPVLFLNFKKFAVISFVANLIAIPLITVILGLAIIGYFFFHIIPFISLVFASFNNFLIAVMIYLLNILSYIKSIKFTGINIGFILIYYLLIFIIFYKRFVVLSIFERILFYKVKVKYVLIAMLLVLLIMPFLNFNHSRKNNFTSRLSYDPQIIIFNIKGKSVFIRTKHGKSILIDGGYKSDALRHIIPFLKRNNIGTIDYIFLTNPMQNRAEGLLQIIKKFRVRNFIDTGYLYDVYYYNRLLEIISEQKTRYIIGHIGKSFYVDDFKIFVLNPPDSLFEKVKSKKATIEENIMNNSMVLHIKWNNFSLLLVGDIKLRAVKYLNRNICEAMESEAVILPDINHNDLYIYRLMDCIKPDKIIIAKNYIYFEKQDKKFVKDIAKEYNSDIIFTEEKGAIKIYGRDGKIRYITSR